MTTHSTNAPPTISVEALRTFCESMGYRPHYGLNWSTWERPDGSKMTIIDDMPAPQIALAVSLEAAHQGMTPAALTERIVGVEADAEALAPARKALEAALTEITFRNLGTITVALTIDVHDEGRTCLLVRAGQRPLFLIHGSAPAGRLCCIGVRTSDEQGRPLADDREEIVLADDTTRITRATLRCLTSIAVDEALQQLAAGY